MVPDDIVDGMRDNEKRGQFFAKTRDGRWALKQAEGQTEPIVPSKNPKESLKEILRQSTDSPANYDIFVELIFQMLSYRPSERISPSQALEHPFIVAGENAVLAE